MADITSYDRCGVIRFPEPVAGEPMRVSASLYVAFRRCPAQALARLDGHFPPETPASFKGALAHRLIRRHLEHGSIPDAEIETVCREEIGTGLNTKMVAAGIRSPSQLRPHIEQVGELYRRFKVFPGEGFEGAEITLEVEAVEGVTLLGKVDAVFRLGARPVLVDWKTGDLGRPMDQLGFYALVWAMDRRELPERVEAVSVATGEREEAVLGVDDLEVVARRVCDLVSEARRTWASASEPEVVAGPWCRFCPILETCREGGSAVAILDGVSM